MLCATLLLFILFLRSIRKKKHERDRRDRERGGGEGEKERCFTLHPLIHFPHVQPGSGKFELHNCLLYDYRSQGTLAIFHCFLRGISSMLGQKWNSHNLRLRSYGILVCRLKSILYGHRTDVQYCFFVSSSICHNAHQTRYTPVSS